MSVNLTRRDGMNRQQNTPAGLVELFVAGGRYVFTLAGKEQHSLLVSASPIERVNSHWEGFLSSKGEMA